MLQNLLADRFQLRFHRETKDMPGFALTIGKKGAKFKPTGSADAGISLGAQTKPDPGPGQAISLMVRRHSMQKLSETLSLFTREPSVDRTALTGLYDFDLFWDEAAGPTLQTAIEEQLGLRLTPRRVPISFFIFDSAQRPSEN